MSEDRTQSIWKFVCPACLVEEIQKELLLYDPSEKVEDIENTGMGVKRIGYLCIENAINKKALCDPDSMLVTNTGDLVLLDRGTSEVLWVDKSGQLKKRWNYLRTHQYQGGFALQDNLVLLTLKNEKYKSVSYYSLEGKFKFSAFLEKESVVPTLAVNSTGEIVALDTECDFMWFINKGKSLYKSVSVLKPGEVDFDLQGAQIWFNTDDEIVLCCATERRIRTYDKTGVYISDFHFTLDDDVLPVSKDDKTIMTDRSYKQPTHTNQNGQKVQLTQVQSISISAESQTSQTKNESSEEKSIPQESNEEKSIPQASGDDLTEKIVISPEDPSSVDSAIKVIDDTPNVGEDNEKVLNETRADANDRPDKGQDGLISESDDKIDAVDHIEKDKLEPINDTKGTTDDAQSQISGRKSTVSWSSSSRSSKNPDARIITIEDDNRLRFAVDSFNCILVADRLNGKIDRYSGQGDFIDSPIISLDKGGGAVEKRWLWDIKCAASGELVVLFKKPRGAPELRVYSYKTPKRFKKKNVKKGEMVSDSKCCIIL